MLVVERNWITVYKMGHPRLDLRPKRNENETGKKGEGYADEERLLTENKMRRAWERIPMWSLRDNTTTQIKKTR